MILVAPEKPDPSLFEYGKWLCKRDAPGKSRRYNRLLVAAHPNYPRRLDIIEQTNLERPDIVVGDSVLGLAERVCAELWHIGHSRIDY